MINKRDILNQISDNDEKIIISKVYDKYINAYKKYEISYTDFLNPAVTSKVNKIFKYDGEVDIFINGGFDISERNIAIFVNKNLYLDEVEAPITACKISYNNKFSKTLQHKDFLGSLIGLGIKREKLGDIHINEGYAIIIVYSDISSYIINNLEYVGRTKVLVEEINLNEYNKEINNKEYKEKTITVASLRLDNVISNVFNLSRSNASKLINNEKVFINWETISNISKDVKEGDIITARGYGRMKIDKVKGVSKKGKMILNIILY